MYIKAIETADKFTRPVHIISRSYGGIVSPGSSTLFFVNEEGMAITCKHVVHLIKNAEYLNSRYNSFRQERAGLANGPDFTEKLAQLEKKYGYRKETTVQVKINFLNSVDSSNFTCLEHPELDLAVIKFEGYSRKFYSSCATFVRDQGKIRQGKSLCRLGYPFPEFTNYRYSQEKDDLEWINSGNPNSPSFPMDGIITRFGSDGKRLISIEMSTPGLRGQSGGPLFDQEGLVYGMQYMTSHLHLGFDIQDKEIIWNGEEKKISNYPFIHVGHCIHADRITEFLRDNHIPFYQEK